MTGKPKAASCDRNNEGVKKTECEPLSWIASNGAGFHLKHPIAHPALNFLGI